MLSGQRSFLRQLPVKRQVLGPLLNDTTARNQDKQPASDWIWNDTRSKSDSAVLMEATSSRSEISVLTVIAAVTSCSSETDRRFEKKKRQAELSASLGFLFDLLHREYGGDILLRNVMLLPN
jgi:hypothetical protein